MEALGYKIGFSKGILLVILLISFATAACSSNRERGIRLSQAHYKLGIANLNNDRLQSAFVEFQKSVKANPKNRDAHYMLGHVYFRQGRLLDAESEFKIVLKLNSKDPEANNYLGRVYAERKEWEKAIHQYERALRNLQYQTPHYAHYHMAIALKNSGQMEEAVKSYSSALKIDPDFIFNGRKWAHVIHDEVGKIFVDLERTDEAIEAFQRAISFTPDYADAHFNVGRAYFDQGSQEKARQSFEKVIDLEPKGELAALAREYLDRLP